MVMTENDALGKLKAKLTCMQLEDLSFIEKVCDRKCDACEYCYAQGTRAESKTALLLAIDALKEIQQYRAIGTVERFKYLSKSEHNYENCHNLTCRTRCEKDGYVKGIDDFVETLNRHEQENWIDHMEYGITWSDIELVAKKLKGE